MPQDRPLPASAEDWLTRAEGDLALARAPLPEGAFSLKFKKSAWSDPDTRIKRPNEIHVDMPI